MLLAEALLIRADLRNKLTALRERLARTAMVQEGDQPVEQPSALLKEATQVAKQLETLVFRINRTNIENRLEEGGCLTELLARRDRLVMEHSIVRSTLDHAVRPPERYGAKEIRWVATVDVPQLEKQADKLGRQIREINTAIQAANWKIELKK